MERTRVGFTIAGVCLGAIILTFIGCDSSGTGRDKPPTAAIGGQDTAATNSTPKPDEGEPKLFATWPTEKFAGALLISGEMIGYHEPCGCTADQKGGLVRRSVLVDLLKKQGWKLGLIDLGTLIQDPAKSRDGPDQTRLKFAMTLKALQMMGYSALGLSVDDLRLGAAETLMQVDNVLGTPDTSLKMVCANATPVEGLGFETKLVPSLRMPIGPVNVGVTSILDPAAFEALNDTSKNDLITVKPPADVLPAILADLEKDTNIQVLMVQGPPELAKSLAQTYPGFDVVVSTHPFSDPPDKPEILNGGNTWLVTAGRKGMYVGVLGLYLDPKERFRYQRVELNKRYDQYKESAAAMRSLIGDEFQSNLKSVGVLQSYPKRPYAEFNTPAEAQFVGAETCKDCHPKTYAHWKTTKHAHAYEPLISDPRDAGRNRENDAACVSCHTVGFEFLSGFVTTEQTPELKGVQCESCHGPASLHVENPKDSIALQAVKRTFDDFKRNHRCIQCHDEDNDPHFDWDKYKPQIDHTGLDKKQSS